MADNRRFIADVERFARLSADKMLRVARQSTQDVVRQAQTTTAQGGDMPVDTGFLRNSLITELRGSEVGAGEDSYTLGIAGMQLGDAFQVSWAAEYAIPRHYMVNANGGLWRDKAAQQWTRIVAENVRRVQ
jgi:hypothetical protein